MPKQRRKDGVGVLTTTSTQGGQEVLQEHTAVGRNPPFAVGYQPL
jgi:hypothetical protein